MRTRTEQFGIVLGRSSIRESDQIVHILGEPLGKITALARGSKNSKRRFFGGLDILDCGRFTLSNPKDGQHIYTLEGLNDRITWSGIRSDLNSLILASHCLELSDKLCALEDPECAKLTKLLLRTLRSIDKGLKRNQSIAVATYFSVEILHSSGYNILDNNEARISPDVNTWFTGMKESAAPRAPSQDDLTYKGLQQLVTYCELVIDSPLHAIKQLSNLTLE
jgi:DNA repair protein RecO (recombination protein O)